MSDIIIGGKWINKDDETTIAVDSVWKHKIKIDCYVRVSMVTNGEVFYVNENGGKKGIEDNDQFLTFYSLHKSADPVIAVDSVWRHKEDGELVYIEHDDGTLCWNLNFSPLGEADVYADDTKGFLSQYEFVCDSKYDSSLAFNAPSVAPDIANETLKPTSAVDLLETSAATLIRCGKKYDSTGNNSERVMDRIVDMFNAATGHELSEAQGNIFMVCLKVVRSETSTYHDDDHYIDGVNYFAMAGEASSKHYKGGV